MPRLQSELGTFFVEAKPFAAQLIELISTLKGEDMLKLPGLIRENFTPKKRAGRPPARRSGTNRDADQLATDNEAEDAESVASRQQGAAPGA